MNLQSIRVFVVCVIIQSMFGIRQMLIVSIELFVMIAVMHVVLMVLIRIMIITISVIIVAWNGDFVERNLV